MFIGWFGHRGMAGIVFAVFVRNESLPHGNSMTMALVCTIVLSILLYGISANSLVAVLARR